MRISNAPYNPNTPPSAAQRGLILSSACTKHLILSNGHLEGVRAPKWL